MLNTKLSLLITLVVVCCLNLSQSLAQSTDVAALSEAVKGMKLRSIGPATMGGRISDIAVSPTDPSTWYVAAGSGGLWKTTNRGNSWQAMFDEQASYSIGTVTTDPHNGQVVWVGTGENVSGRHVGWGDGVYCSRNGGKTWQNMGLNQSEHIGKILVDPRNSNIVFVAAEGPLWSSGGERGLYKSEDGGSTWQKVLSIDENTGVTDVEFDPSNPDVMYAAAYQRRRHTWSLLAGGPQSGIYKSTDNGATWRRMETGLPKGDMGKIGLAVTAADPQMVYATIEAQEDEKGFYRSMDKGESWERRNSYTSGGTGPHYYQELEASQTHPQLVYQMDVFLHVTRDGGKTIHYLGTGREKHSDNHALWIDPDDGEHLLAGSDGGLYESFDEGSTWRHFPNLPISQFYKLGLDNSEPFYNIVGGAQDLGTLLGPSRTMNTEGIRNQDWSVPLGADGYDTSFDPEDPNIVYMEIQQGSLYKYDKRSEEVLFIQPQPAPGDAPERWNWDSPFLISPHDHERLYYGSQRLWQSEDGGYSWTPISEDLTTNTNRYELEMIDRVWSVDALYDNGAMSKYATLTSISESHLAEGLLYTGSDDGMISVSEDGGQTWQQAGALPQVPERSFINDIEASSHDQNTVFAAADAHKFGNYTPFLFMSADRGRSWRSIVGDLPESTIVWVIKQDHIDPNLLFIGTEYGIYFSPNKGTNWIKLEGNVPTIPFRDIELHPRNHDLVGASFGRGFYVLDDYTPLRNMAEVVSRGENALFAVRDAWWYVPNVPMQAKGMPSQGTTAFVAENPPFGAVFTYYLHDLPKSKKAQRQSSEQSLKEQKLDVPFPGWDRLLEEASDDAPRVLLLVRDGAGEPLRWLEGNASQGLHRTNWDLRLPPPDPINLVEPDFKPPWIGDALGPLAAPGTYSVELYVYHNGALESQGASREFVVKPVSTAPEGTDFEAVAAFQKKTSELYRQASAANKQLDEAKESLRHMKAALTKTSNATPELFDRLEQLEDELSDLRMRLTGNTTRRSMNEATVPSIMSRLSYVKNGHWETRQMPTDTQRRNIAIAEERMNKLSTDLDDFYHALAEYEKSMEDAGAPWTPGRKMR